jgi:hypothetical protein
MAMRDAMKSYIENEKVPIRAVPTPELPQWDGQIFVTRASSRALATFWKDAEEDGQIDERAGFVVQVAVDRDGSRIFQDEDVPWLSTCAYLTSMVERLYWAGRDHCGLTEENRTAWRKNSECTGGVGSPCSCAAPATPVTDSATTAS